MNHSFNINLILKMTALSVIFFATPTACSVVAHSRGESERYVDDSLSDKTFNFMTLYIRKKSIFVKDNLSARITG